MLVTRSFAVVGLLAIALGAAPAAQAGVQLYYGSWIAQSFGNDVTNGAGGETESDAWSVLGIPLGNKCNAINPRCAYSLTGAEVANQPTPTYTTDPLTAKQFDPLAAFCVPLNAFCA